MYIGCADRDCHFATENAQRVGKRTGRPLRSFVGIVVAIARGPQTRSMDAEDGMTDGASAFQLAPTLLRERPGALRCGDRMPPPQQIRAPSPRRPEFEPCDRFDATKH